MSAGTGDWSRSFLTEKKVVEFPTLPHASPKFASQGSPGLTSTGLAPTGVEASHPAALEDVDVPAATSRAGAQHLRAQ